MLRTVQHLPSCCSAFEERKVATPECFACSHHRSLTIGCHVVAPSSATTPRMIMPAGVPAMVLGMHKHRLLSPCRIGRHSDQGCLK